MKPGAINVGIEHVTTQDFSEAIWCILAKDYYDFDDEPSGKLAEDIRSHFSVDVVLAISRDTGGMSGAVENDVIGLVRSNDGQTQIVYWASDASRDANLMFAQTPGTFSSTITRLFRDLGANLGQISGTEIFNKRPDLLTKDELGEIIDQLITDNDLGWDDSVDGTETTIEFLEKHYTE